MTRNAELSADLRALTEALDEPGVDIEQSLDRLLSDLARAVPGFLGMTVKVRQHDRPEDVALISDTIADGRIRASLHITFRGDSGTSAPVDLVLYSGVSGGFVDLAADLAWPLRRLLATVILDEDLIMSATGPLHDVSNINQAVGVLIGRGRTPHEAHRHLDTIAAAMDADRHAAALSVLARVTAHDPPPAEV